MANEIRNQAKDFSDMLNYLKPRIALSLPKSTYTCADRFVEVLRCEAKRNPKLLNCTPASLGASILFAARLGLEPDTQLGHFHIIPYKDKATVVLGYPGLIELALRSPHIDSIWCNEVYEGDDYESLFGTETKIIHRPGDNPGAVVRVYSVARFANGSVVAEEMAMPHVEKIRKASPYGNQGPWVTHYGAMARKTVLRKLCKYLPRAFDLQKAITVEEAVESGREVMGYDMIDDMSDDDIESIETQEAGEAQPKKQEAPTAELLKKLNASEANKS